jgi:small subunit ribosomal protein S1
MKSPDSFASLMEESLAAGTSRARRRLKAGEVVEGVVIQISADSVFLDVGTPGDARLPRAEVTNAAGELRVKVGDRISAVVLDASGETPVLSAGFGRGAVDISSLELARESGTPVEGKVIAANKGGVEVEVAQLRAFCPASQLDTAHTADLNAFIGQTLEFRVIEIRDRGRSIVLSRRSLLEQQRREREKTLAEQLKPGADVEGSVQAIQRHGALVDLGGLLGFVHVSELAPHRVERVEDVVKVGDPVKVRVLAVETSDKGLRVKLSMKALVQAESGPAAPSAEEVLAGTVSRVTNFGVFVQTPKGEGLVPVRELGLAPNADPRRAFPVGREVKVVLFNRDAGSGKLRFSMVGVANVEERQNYREFSKAGAQAEKPRSFGSLGDLMKEKLNLPSQVLAAPPATPAAAHPSPAQAAPAAKAPPRGPLVDGVQRRKR